MNAWWNNLPLNEKFYWFLAFPFTAMFIIQTIMIFIGAGSDMVGHADTSLDLNEDLNTHFSHNTTSHPHNMLEDATASFNLFTLRNGIVFFTIFSWCGIASLNSGLSTIVSVIISAMLGIIVTVILSGILYFALKMTTSGTLVLNNALNCIGKVYLTIPEEKKGMGKVMISIQGSLRELDAITEGEEIPTGTQIIVTQIIDNQFLLVKKHYSKEVTNGKS